MKDAIQSYLKGAFYPSNFHFVPNPATRNATGPCATLQLMGAVYTAQSLMCTKKGSKTF